MLGYAIEHSERAMVANRRTDLLIKGQPLHRHTSNCSPDSAKAVETTEMLLYIVVTGEGSTATSDWSVIRYARKMTKAWYGVVSHATGIRKVVPTRHHQNQPWLPATAPAISHQAQHE